MVAVGDLMGQNESHWYPCPAQARPPLSMEQPHQFQRHRLAALPGGGGSPLVHHPANLTLTLAAEGEAAGICMGQGGSS